MRKPYSHPREIAAVVRAIKAERPDLRLHGFGCKLTALRSAEVRAALWSADSLAWSYAARKQGRNPNDWREAQRFLDQIVAQEQLAHQDPSSQLPQMKVPVQL